MNITDLFHHCESCFNRKLGLFLDYQRTLFDSEFKDSGLIVQSTPLLN